MPLQRLFAIFGLSIYSRILFRAYDKVQLFIIYKENLNKTAQKQMNILLIRMTQSLFVLRFFSHELFELVCYSLYETLVLTVLVISKHVCLAENEKLNNSTLIRLQYGQHTEISIQNINTSRVFALWYFISKLKNFAILLKLCNGNLLRCAICLQFYSLSPCAITKTTILFIPKGRLILYSLI